MSTAAHKNLMIKVLMAIIVLLVFLVALILCVGMMSKRNAMSKYQREYKKDDKQLEQVESHSKLNDYEQGVKDIKNAIYKLNDLKSFEYTSKGCDGDEFCFEGLGELDLEKNQYRYYQKVNTVYEEEDVVSDYIVLNPSVYSGFQVYEKNSEGKYIFKDDRGMKFSGLETWKWIDAVEELLNDTKDQVYTSRMKDFTQTSTNKVQKTFETKELDNGTEYKYLIVTKNSYVDKSDAGEIIRQGEDVYTQNQELVARIDSNGLLTYLKVPYVYNNIEYTITDTNKEYKFEI